MKPDITVLMVVRNEERYVGRAIKSILAQSYRNFRFVIVDDGSKDMTEKVIRAIHDKRITFYHYSESESLTKRLNQVLKIIKTEFVARMDSHNISSPGRLEKQRNYLLNNPEVVLVGSNYKKVDERGKILFASNFPQTWEKIRNKLFEKNVFKHASWFFRYNVIKKEGFYDENFRFSQDYEFLLRLVPKYPVFNLKEHLVTEILLPQSSSQKNRLAQALLVLRAQLKSAKYYPLWQRIYLVRTLIFIIKICIWKILN